MRAPERSTALGECGGRTVARQMGECGGHSGPPQMKSLKK